MLLYCEQGTVLHLFNLNDESPHPYFTEEEQNLFYMFSEKRKREFAASRGYLKHFIGAQTNQLPKNIVLKKAENGKILYPPLFFNIAHSNNHLLIGFSNKEIGIDIEDTTKIRAWRNIVDRYFSKEEADWIKDDVLKFYQLWTLKEARYKCDSTKTPTIKNKKFEMFSFENNKPILPNYVLHNMTHENVICGWCTTIA